MARRKFGGPDEAAADDARGTAPVPRSGEERRQPIHRIRIRSTTAAIWQNHSERGPWYSVTISRSYRDAAGNWQTSESFSGTDLLVLAEVARAAFLWIVQTTQNPSDGQGLSRQGGVVDSEIPF